MFKICVLGAVLGDAAAAETHPGRRSFRRLPGHPFSTMAAPALSFCPAYFDLRCAENKGLLIGGQIRRPAPGFPGKHAGKTLANTACQKRV